MHYDSVRVGRWKEGYEATELVRGREDIVHIVPPRCPLPEHIDAAGVGLVAEFIEGELSALDFDRRPVGDSLVQRYAAAPEANCNLVCCVDYALGRPVVV